MPNSVASLKKALQSTPIEELDVAVIATTADGSIGYWNGEAERLYGWRAEEVMGSNIVDITPSMSKRPQAEEIMAALRKGEPWQGVMQLRRRDGTVFEAFVIDTPLPHGAILGVSGPADEAARVRERNEALLSQLMARL